MKTYQMEVVYSYWQTITIEAESIEEAQQTALDIFDINKAEPGAGEVYDTVEV